MLIHTLIFLIIVYCHNYLHEHSLTAQSMKFGNFVLTVGQLVGRVVGKSYARQPVNLGTWEPDDIGYMSSYGAKAVSEVKVPPA